MMANIVIKNNHSDESVVKEMVYNFGLELDEVSIISVCGNGISYNANLLMTLMNSIKKQIGERLIKSVIIGASRNSVLLIINKENAAQLLREIHNKLIQI